MSLNAGPGAPPIPASSSPHALATAAFVENLGQIGDPDILFSAAARGVRAGFARDAVFLSIADPEGGGAVVRIAFEGANSIAPAGRGELLQRSHFFVGGPTAWRTSARAFAEVVYEGLYEGIDLSYRTSAEGVKYEFRARPWADIGRIRLRFDGVEGLAVDEGGGLEVRTVAGTIRDSAPVSSEGTRSVPCAFALRDARFVGFECPGRDPSRALVIDPLVFSTYLGDAGSEFSRSIDVDALGSTYVTGETDSLDFPTTPGAFDATYGGGFYDAYVAKFAPDGRTLVYAAFLGGTGDDVGISLAVDATGRAHVTGQTFSPDFPTTPGAFDATQNGSDAFVVRLGPAGDVLEYATFLGGTGEEIGNSLALDDTGHAYVVGLTGSFDFPATAGAHDLTYNGGFADIFIAKLEPDGTALQYATYLGGGDTESGLAIAIDGMGNAFVTGGTGPNFPVTPGAYDTTYNDVGPIPFGDAYVAKLDAAGSSVVYATFLGGRNGEHGAAIHADAGGNVTVVGYTDSPNFPTTAGAWDLTYGGSGDSYVVRLDPLGSTLVYGTFLGGSAFDQAYDIAVDAFGNVHVVGTTRSADFPARNATVNPTYSGGLDGYLAKFNASSTGLVNGTFLGGVRDDVVYGIALDDRGVAFVSGWTVSSDFPTTPNAFDLDCGVSGDCDFDGLAYYPDGFVASIDLLGLVVRVTVDTSPSGLQVEVDGTTYAAPVVRSCNLGAPLALNTSSPQGGPPTRYQFIGWSDGGNQSHTIPCFEDVTVIATFRREHETIVATIPSTLLVVVDGLSAPAPRGFWWVEGSTHTLEAPSPQGSTGTRYSFSLWSDGGARTHDVVIGGPQTFVASFLTEHNVTVTTDPVGLGVDFDGVAVLTPFQYWCLAATTHTVNATSPQTLGPIRRTFRAWSDGGALNHTVACDAPATYTAFFDTDYEVTVDTSPLLLEAIVDGVPFTAPSSWWCPANTPHTLDAPTPQGVGLTRYVFASWSDGLPRLHSFTCTAPLTFLATFDTEHWVGVDTSPPGLQVTVEGTTASAPQGLWWPEGASLDLDVPTPQSGNATRYTFAGWLDDPARARTVVVTGPARYVARFSVDYLVTFNTSPPGLGLLVDGQPVATPFSAWWANGSTHSFSAPSLRAGTPGVQHVFIAWSDAGPQGRQFSVNGSSSLTATYRTQYRLALSSLHGTPVCDVADCWYDAGDTAKFGVETIVGGAVGTRYVFQTWVGDVGFPYASGTVVMDAPKSSEAQWRVEHFLRVDSPFGKTAGEGWYPEGTVAVYSVWPTEVDAAGGRFVFRGWTGDASGAAATAGIVMSGPRAVTADWEATSDWWWFLLPLGVVPFLVLFFLWRRRKRERAGTSAEGPAWRGR